jgi:HAD superfamily hydrolase (TIGR01484 family)
MQISAILSDYDGTLCSTSNMRDSSSNKIPVELDARLSEISRDIPVCVISSKDFGFLSDKITFARIVSCIMGIETINLKRLVGDELIHIKNDSNVLFDTHLITDIDTLTDNSVLLSSLAKEISQTFKDIAVDHKYISKERILAGITIDYRHLEDWLSCKTKLEPLLFQRIQQTKKSHPSSSASKIYVEMYSTHPFVDIYGIKCDKGSAFDSVLKILDMDRSKNKVMYLGDSENDNAAFAKADVSIGVHSDRRLHPRLDCQYIVEFDRLALFLKKLSHENFEFSDNLFY